MYRVRVVDSELTERLQSSGAVLIQGPKVCGKTETALQAAKSQVRLDVDDQARRAAKLTPDLVLIGDTPRLIDEWQRVPEIWDHIRRAVDKRQAQGQFILTGSMIPGDEKVRHSGAGRMARLTMRPMSLYETGQSTGEVSLSAMLSGDSHAGSRSEITVSDVADLIAVGGWPLNLGRSAQVAIRANRDYLGEVARVDLWAVEGIRRAPQKVLRVLQTLGRNVATEMKVAKVAADTGGVDGPLDRATVEKYLVALERLFLLEPQPPWATHLRGRARLRQAHKIHFVDPSLAVAALRATPDQLRGDLNFLGFLFESLVVRDLRIYGQAIDAQVCHYRDSDHLEVDAIVESGAGEWAAFEVKLGDTERIDDGTRNLLRFAAKVDTSKCGEPAVLGVITATEYGYTREDGVVVIPIGNLGP